MKESIRKLFTNVWNVPNVLTMFRIVLIPVFVILQTNGRLGWALIVFLTASLTDFLDGFIARKYHLVTDFGKLFDPLADKLMVCIALICQCASGILPWAPVIIVMLKELLMVVGGLIMLKKDIVVYANMFGKCAQVLFILALSASFLYKELLSALSFRLDLVLLWISVAATLVALSAYAAGAVRQLRNRSAKES
ncbi:MAG: CDP-diacylglycerol--glycerol-3-phosphate 3-phosphatidyltransferase [Clostridia bacterium]|nr:CDP-diacylglycerol--glycerol-3-phosphate 3-phosphatidyltransferase [Clostridia bacterium]